jgi:hypothetical protein
MIYCSGDASELQVLPVIYSDISYYCFVEIVEGGKLELRTISLELFNS